MIPNPVQPGPITDPEGSLRPGGRNFFFSGLFPERKKYFLGALWVSAV
jgi:hypothetical protein